jgi:DNA repair protein RAD7
VIGHSGCGLESLNINGWKNASEESLMEIAKRSKILRTLDVGWCREVDDFVVKGLIEGCERLKEIKGWGCNRLTENCTRKVCGVSGTGLTNHADKQEQKSVRIYGIESDLI